MSRKAQDGGNHYEVGQIEDSPTKESPTKKIERSKACVNFRSRAYD